MWTKGFMEIDGIKFDYYIKHFAEPSQFGINGGRISKLQLLNGGYMVCSYDRGWASEPLSDISNKAVNMLIDKFN